MNGKRRQASASPGEEHWLERALELRWLRVTLAVLIALALLFRVAQVLTAAAGPAWGYDFSAYWLAGRHLLAGEPIYTAGQLAGPYSPQQPFVYLYPPFLAAGLMPMAAAFSDYRVAMWLWLGIGCLVLGMSVWLLGRLAGGLSRRTLVILVGLSFALAPVGFELVMGNVHLLLLGLLAGAWLGLRASTRTGDLAAGVLIGTASVIKVFPALLVLWLFLTGRRRAALIALVASVALVLATLPIVGLQAWLDFPRVLTNLGPPPEPWSSISPTTWLSELVGFTPARIVVTVAGLALLFWSARTQTAPLSYGLAVMISILVAPTLYPHYLALAVLPLLLGLLYTRSTVGVTLAYLALFVGGQLALLGLQDPLNRIAASVGALAPLALLIAVGARSEQESRRDEVPGQPKAAGTVPPPL